VITIAGEEAKREGWKILFAQLLKEGYPGNLPVIFAEQEKKYIGGPGLVKGDRYDILRDTFRVLKIDAAKISEKVDECAERYDVLTRKLIVDSGVYPETIETLNALKEKGIPAYVVSASPEKALIKSIEALGLTDLFEKKGLLGFPIRKPEHLKNIITSRAVKPVELLFVGDSNGDKIAAEVVRCQFVGIFSSLNNWGSHSGFPVISRLNEIFILPGA
jgi:phosphoglycolate phosphatase-like HAD superfamily hydrolase